MSTLCPPPPPTLAEPRPFTYTRALYHRLGEAGLVGPARVQLIRGELIQMPPIGPDHGLSSMVGADALRRAFPADAFTVRSGLPFVAADESEPEPDLCVVAGPSRTIRAHPSACLLLIEISESTLAYDRGAKAALYAESGVADYWIVNLVDRAVELYRNPHRTAQGGWAYDPPVLVPPTGACTPLALPATAIPVSDLLG